MNNLFSKNRVEAFSDGIFAIIVTLLVLELRVPHLAVHDSARELLAALLDLIPKFVGWIISFFTVCVIWVNHHRLFKQYKHLDHGIFWWNAVLLLWTSFIPFPTAVIGDYATNPVSIVLYGTVMALMAVSFSFMRFYVLRKPSLLEDNVDVASFRKGTKLSVVFGPLMYIIGLAAGFIHPYISFAIYFGIPVYFIFSENKTKNEYI